MILLRSNEGGSPSSVIPGALPLSRTSLIGRETGSVPWFARSSWRAAVPAADADRSRWCRKNPSRPGYRQRSGSPVRRRRRLDRSRLPSPNLPSYPRPSRRLGCPVARAPAIDAISHLVLRQVAGSSTTASTCSRRRGGLGLPPPDRLPRRSRCRHEPSSVRVRGERLLPSDPAPWKCQCPAPRSQDMRDIPCRRPLRAAGTGRASPSLCPHRAQRRRDHPGLSASRRLALGH